VIIVPLRGAISRVSVTDTAFALREPAYEIDIARVWNTPAVKAEVVRWVQATRDNLQPFAHGVYVNQLGDTSEQTGSFELWTELRSSRRDQEKVRPKQRAATQPKHQAGQPLERLMAARGVASPNWSANLP
jgi:hypothetical protein